MNKLCPTCNRPTFEETIATKLPYVKQRIYEAIAKAGEAGINKWEIMDKVYGVDPDNAPESDSIIKAHICYMNRRLKKEGIKIKGWRTGPRGFKLYRLEQLT